MSPNIRGAFLMMASMASFTLNDVCIKATGGALPLFQLLTLRGILATALILGLVHAMGGLDLRIGRQDWVLIGVRSAAEVGAAFFFITALLKMPLANVTAILQVLPLTVTLGAALLFREAVGWRRFAAILFGFVGVVLILRPGPEGFNVFALYALGAVLCVTVRDLTTRRMSADVPSMTVTLAASVGVLVFSAIATVATEEWAPLDTRLALLVAGSSFLIIGGYLFSVLVMRTGDISFIAPFRYTGLLWALLLGWAVFGHWPDPLTLLGAGIVVASGLFTLYRERLVLQG